MSDILQVAANGFIAGSLVALLAVSYSLIYSILRFINFVFGEVLMLAAYTFVLASMTLHFPILIAAIVAVVLLSVVGFLIQIGAYRPFYRHSRLACLITALGVSLILQNVALMVFGGPPLVLASGLAGSVVHLGPVALTEAQIAVFLAAFVLLLLTDSIVFRSATGLRLRALADNLPMAEILGVEVDQAISRVFLVGSCLAAFSGVLLSLEHLVKPTMGTSPGIQAFAACVLGGIGSVRGAVVAAFLITSIAHLVNFVWPLVTPETTAYAVLVFALALFPEGISTSFGRVWARMLEAASNSGARVRGQP